MIYTPNPIWNPYTMQKVFIINPLHSRVAHREASEQNAGCAQWKEIFKFRFKSSVTRWLPYDKRDESKSSLKKTSNSYLGSANWKLSESVSYTRISRRDVNRCLLPSFSPLRTRPLKLKLIWNRFTVETDFQYSYKYPFTMYIDRYDWCYQLVFVRLLAAVCFFCRFGTRDKKRLVWEEIATRQGVAQPLLIDTTYYAFAFPGITSSYNHKTDYY